MERDPVAEALRVATKAMPTHAFHDDHEIAAITIAAFLRALPKGSRADCHPIRMYATQLADEVERAAQGERG